jgi:hypothetical protein
LSANGDFCICQQPTATTTITTTAAAAPKTKVGHTEVSLPGTTGWHHPVRRVSSTPRIRLTCPSSSVKALNKKILALLAKKFAVSRNSFCCSIFVPCLIRPSTLETTLGQRETRVMFDTLQSSLKIVEDHIKLSLKRE